MTKADLFEIMERFENSSIHELKYESENNHITLRKAPKQVAIAQSEYVTNTNINAQSTQAKAEETKAVKAEEGTAVKAPLIGTFYSASSPEEKSFVEVGQKVKKGDTLCIIEAMKMLNEVPSPCDGVVTKVLVQNEELVSFDQALFFIQE